MSPEPMVTIIIRSWNSLEFLKLCLESIKLHTTIPFNLIIVDNGSTDGSKEFLKEIKVKRIFNKKNVGGIKALEQAERLVETKYICSVDSDIVVTPGWLKILLETYQANPKVRAIGPIKPSAQLNHPYLERNSREVWEEIKKNNQAKGPSQLLELFIRGRDFVEFSEDFKKANSYGDKILETPPEFLSGCCILVETEFMKRIGGLADTSFKVYGCEDADRCWRIAKFGYKVMRTGKVFIHHFEGGSREKNNLDTKSLLTKNNRIFLKKWHKEFWGLVRNKQKEGLSLKDISEKYWFMRELFKSLRQKDMPSDLKKQFFRIALVVKYSYQSSPSFIKE